MLGTVSWGCRALEEAQATGEQKEGEREGGSPGGGDGERESVKRHTETSKGHCFHM